MGTDSLNLFMKVKALNQHILNTRPHRDAVAGYFSKVKIGMIVCSNSSEVAFLYNLDTGRSTSTWTTWK
jgi:hypothetical protein